MERKESIHGGHRNRMIEKVLTNRDAFAEHEILEVLLYKYIPRKDTNAIAHKLLRTFGSIEKIFSASPEDLQVVDGIGKKVSAELCVLGKIFQHINLNKNAHKKQNWMSFDKNKEEIIKIFEGVYEEKLLVILLDEKYNKINQLVFNSPDFSSVTAEIIDIVSAIAVHKPKNIILAHNHPSGEVEPSKTDDLTTQKINLLCSMHGICLLDHIIVAKNKAYSYYHQHRLEYIKEKADITKIIANLSEEQHAKS